MGWRVQEAENLSLHRHTLLYLLHPLIQHTTELLKLLGLFQGEGQVTEGALHPLLPLSLLSLFSLPLLILSIFLQLEYLYLERQEVKFVLF